MCCLICRLGVAGPISIAPQTSNIPGRVGVVGDLGWLEGAGVLSDPTHAASYKGMRYARVSACVSTDRTFDAPRAVCEDQSMPSSCS